MGLAHLTAGLVSAGGNLAVERFPVVGLARTSSADQLVTDSAAAATALACGVKTRNGAIGVDPDGRPVPSILEKARARGLKTGVVVTSSLADATPASFLAHRPSRKQQEEIAADIAASGADVLVGGGRCFFTSRPDGRYLLGELAARGYAVVEDPSRLASAPPGKLAALLAEGDLSSEAKGRGDLLRTAVSEALARLTSARGFVLVVEASQVDFAAHDGDGRGVSAEVVDLDRTVARILDFAAKDGRTLVVLTADHETGGLALTGGSIEQRNVETGFVTKGHTATMVPVFAFGPGSAAFSGVYENTGVGERLRAALGL
jgi:alkaline phosphatase